LHAVLRRGEKKRLARGEGIVEKRGGDMGREK
jgi:hypothetical protein